MCHSFHYEWTFSISGKYRDTPSIFHLVSPISFCLEPADVTFSAVSWYEVWCVPGSHNTCKIWDSTVAISTNFLSLHICNAFVNRKCLCSTYLPHSLVITVKVLHNLLPQNSTKQGRTGHTAHFSWQNAFYCAKFHQRT